jgi:sugar-phosphatase
VVTSADARLAQARLGAAGIDVPALVTLDDLTAGKLDPQGHLGQLAALLRAADARVPPGH